MRNYLLVLLFLVVNGYPEDVNPVSAAYNRKPAVTSKRKPVKGQPAESKPGRRPARNNVISVPAGPHPTPQYVEDHTSPNGGVLSNKAFRTPPGHNHQNVYGPSLDQRHGPPPPTPNDSLTPGSHHVPQPSYTSAGHHRAPPYHPASAPVDHHVPKNQFTAGAHHVPPSSHVSAGSHGSPSYHPAPPPAEASTGILGLSVPALFAHPVFTPFRKVSDKLYDALKVDKIKQQFDGLISKTKQKTKSLIGGPVLARKPSKEQPVPSVLTAYPQQRLYGKPGQGGSCTTRYCNYRKLATQPNTNMRYLPRPRNTYTKGVYGERMPLSGDFVMTRPIKGQFVVLSY